MDLTKNKLIQQYIKNNLFGDFLGMSFQIHSPGNISYRININEHHLATPKACHGGVIAALCDATLGVGALSLVCDKNEVVSTMEMKVSYLSAVQLNDQLIAYSKIAKSGKRIIFITCEVFNQNNEIVAIASATMNAYPAEKAGYKLI